MSHHPLAGQPAPQSLLDDVPRLVSDYFVLQPDPEEAGQRVSFGTSGHRGSASDAAFNEAHIIAVSQAVADYRRHAGIDGPLFLGKDTHALSEPAFGSAVEVLAANGVNLIVDAALGYTPTPVISHAILSHNRQAGADRYERPVALIRSSSPLPTTPPRTAVSSTTHRAGGQRTARSRNGSSGGRTSCSPNHKASVASPGDGPWRQTRSIGMISWVPTWRASAT